jgi:hypothetical protein
MHGRWPPTLARRMTSRRSKLLFTRRVRDKVSVLCGMRTLSLLRQAALLVSNEGEVTSAEA